MEFHTKTHGAPLVTPAPKGSQPGSRGVSLNDGTASDLSRTISYWNRRSRSSLGAQSALKRPLKMSSPPTSSPLPWPESPVNSEPGKGAGTGENVGPYVAPFS